MTKTCHAHFFAKQMVYTGIIAALFGIWLYFILTQ